ncbi:MAG: DUF58 domain-containing protein [Gammaproteobacteria bacterium]|nr:DUF58 domain-containing protein [Gammaproteobacteria bacterium]
MAQIEIPDSVVVSMQSLIALRLQAGKSIGSTRKKSTAQRSGNFASPFRGRGMDFSEVRLYQPGDDIRSIDWRVTARTGKTHTKLYTEERERAIYFVVDTGPSMQFGTQVSFKSVVASKVAGLLAWSSMSHGDRVGGIFFSGNKHKEIKPVGGKRGVLTFLKNMVDWSHDSFSKNDESTGSGFVDVVSRLKRVAKPGSLIFIISDFNVISESARLYLRQISQHCDLALINVYDELEKNAPPAGNYMLSDGSHSGKFVANGKSTHDTILSDFIATEDKLKQFCLKSGIHFFSICSTDDLSGHITLNMHRRAGGK